MAHVLAPKILVNAIAPGPFQSKTMAATIYLASRATNFVTGAVIPVDGGLSTTAGLSV